MTSGFERHLDLIEKRDEETGEKIGEKKKQLK